MVQCTLHAHISINRTVVHRRKECKVKICQIQVHIFLQAQSFNVTMSSRRNVMKSMYYHDYYRHQRLLC